MPRTGREWTHEAPPRLLPESFGRVSTPLPEKVRKQVRVSPPVADLSSQAVPQVRPAELPELRPALATVDDKRAREEQRVNKVGPEPPEPEPVARVRAVEVAGSDDEHKKPKRCAESAEP